MALLTCNKCKGSYSDTLNGCPHCGFLLKYSCRDEGSADFFYTYNSDVTFGNRSTVY